MNAKQYFPEGIASGDAFINRVKEREYLINRIKAVKHSVLIAPRRYGKTSLVTKVAEEMGIPYCVIDLLAASSEEYVRDQFVEKVGYLAVQLLPALHKAKEKLLGIFHWMKPELSIGVFGQKLTFNFAGTNPLQNITDLLLKLDETACFFKKKAVIFIDEFQQISQLKEYQSIEAAIRHAVERSKSIIYVFSGSQRNLLQQMFGDQGRPLYRLCQTINIERMEKDVYVAYLQHMAHLRWKKKLSQDFIDRIMLHTKLHPFYVNVLCQLLWEYANIPQLNDVDFAWDNYVKTQRYLIGHDILKLSPNQRKVFSELAKRPTAELQSVNFIGPIKISASSAQQALAALLEKDLVYKSFDNLYYVLDPAMEYYLNNILWTH